MKRTIPSSGFPLLILLIFLCSFIAGCDNTDTPPENPKEEVPAESASGKVMKVDKVTFSVPSPIQISFLIKKSGANYKKSLLHTTVKTPDYSTNFSRAMVLGIYGSDLGYCSIYDQTQDAIGYLNAIRSLADGLGITAGFDQTLLSRFKDNLGKKDSILNIITQAFRNSDGFLKNNQRNDIGALILAGGWLEALHLMTDIAKTNANTDVIERIGDQKSTLENVIKLLEPYQEQKEISAFIEELNGLGKIYEDIPVNYTYHASAHDSLKKITVITSENKVEIKKEHIERISVMVEKMRDGIIK